MLDVAQHWLAKTHRQILAHCLIRSLNSNCVQYLHFLR